MAQCITRTGGRTAWRTPLCVAAVAAATAAALVTAPTASSVTSLRAGGGGPDHTVVKRGLDNPRQLSFTRDGRLVIAEAGHGSYKKENCSGKGREAICLGRSGKVSVIANGKYKRVMTGLLSGAGADGSFATGPDGAGKRPGGSYQAIITYAPPEFFPEGIPGKRQAGKLLAGSGSGDHRTVANIARFEINRDPDGEGVDSNPYALLALRSQTLVADAGGDYIASVRQGKVRLWATLPEYGKRVDAVPTIITRGGDGKIYVGELHSEQPGEARVHRYDRRGNELRSWGGFTTITGVARTKDGTLYVSELFGGDCDGDSCALGQVTRVAPNGKRTTMPVPFPAGIAARGDRVMVSAFSVASAKGFGGSSRQTSGQIWRLRF